MKAPQTQRTKTQRTKLWAKIMRRNFPRSLWARVLLIILVPIILMQVLITGVFFQMHWQTVTGKLSEGLAGDIAWAVNAYDADPTPGNLARIQQPFEHAGRSEGSQHAKGAGLGLTLVKAFAELHGGALVLASRSGHGFCATLLMPAAD